MDEQAVFERFHEALELELNPGAYERFRTDFMDSPVAGKRRPVFRPRFTKMTLRVSAAVAVVVIAIVAAAAIIALNSRPTSYVPAGSGNLRTSSPAATPSPVTAHAMDAPVTLPNNFPKDFPVYPAARSTFVGYDYSFGSLNWTINWETTDSADQAYAWYRVHLDQGDWKITSATAGSIEFTRKSNPNCVGDVTFTQRYPGVTQIDVTVCG